MTLRRVTLRLAVFAFVCGFLLGVVVPKLLAAEEAEPAPQQQTHTVQSGDTLWSLAGRYGPNQDPRRFIYEIQTINRITSPRVFPGQKIILPD